MRVVKTNTYDLDKEQVLIFTNRREIEDEGDEGDEDEKMDEDTSGVDEPEMQEGGEMEVEDEADMEADEADMEEDEDEAVEDYHTARIRAEWQTHKLVMSKRWLELLWQDVVNIFNVKKRRHIPSGVTALISEQFSKSRSDYNFCAKIGKHVLQKAKAD